MVANALMQWVPGCRVEHIGASSIKGAISKADLDVALIVAEHDLANVVSTLKKNGYCEQINTLLTEQLCMLIYERTGYEHAVQVVASGSIFEGFVRFRDLLNASPHLVAAYNQIKVAAAPLGTDAYRAAKASFIESVLRKELGD